MVVTHRLFRFAVVAAVPPPGRSWVEEARRFEGLGYSAVQVPDTLGTLATFPALASAAAATSTLRVGSYVLAVPNHRPAAVAHEALTLDVLSGGRLELGLGAGRPDAAAEAAALGVPFGSAGERIALLRETIGAVRARFAQAAQGGHGPLRPVQAPHPPLLVAGAGDRMLRLAAEEADIVAFGLPIDAGEDVLAARSDRLRELAGSRAQDLELALNIAVVGEQSTPWLASAMGADPAHLLRVGAVSALAGTPAQMAEVLRRRRERTGVSYLQVNVMFAEGFAPVVEMLAGT
jgi:probable F420-dependent oxidoreductase